VKLYQQNDRNDKMINSRKKLIENHILPCRIEGSFENLKADLLVVRMDSFNSCTSVMFLCENVTDKETSRQNAV